MIDGALMTAGAAYILFVSSNFLTPFQSFIQLVSIGLSAWAAVVVIYLFGRWRSTAPRHGVSPAAVVAWVIGLILGLLFSSTSLFVGPLAKGIFATSSLSYVVSFAVSGLVYLLLVRARSAGGRSAPAAVAGSASVGARPAASAVPSDLLGADSPKSA